MHIKKTALFRNSKKSRMRSQVLGYEGCEKCLYILDSIKWRTIGHPFPFPLSIPFYKAKNFWMTKEANETPSNNIRKGL